MAKVLGAMNALGRENNFKSESAFGRRCELLDILELEQGCYSLSNRVANTAKPSRLRLFGSARWVGRALAKPILLHSGKKIDGFRFRSTHPTGYPSYNRLVTCTLLPIRQHRAVARPFRSPLH